MRDGHRIIRSAGVEKPIVLIDNRERMPWPLREIVQHGIVSDVHPNAVCGLLDAVEAKFGIPVVYTSPVRSLATERAASWLSKHFTYWWLEEHGYGRVLIDTDRL